MKKVFALINSFYIQRINHVIDYIEDHLSHKFTLDELAEIAMFSKYHFHRIFKNVAGDTLNNYIKRLRMEKAGRKLRNQSNQSIQDISMELGYLYTANFSRDFQEYYNCSPTDFRKGSFTIPERELVPSNDLSIQFKGIEFLDDKMVIYKRVSTGYNPKIISEVFYDLYVFAQENKLLESNDQFIGAGYDDPDYTPADKCRYDACMVINHEIDLRNHPSFNRKKLKGGRYAIFYFSGTNEQFARVWDNIFYDWVLSSDYIPNDKPHLEMYLPSNEFEEKGILKANFCLPVQPINSK